MFAHMNSDHDLVEAAEGEACTACGRASVECSRAPCPDVREDRGEASRWRVIFVAEGIDVTGRPDEVERLAREDAREFAGSWEFASVEVEAAADEDRTDVTFGPDPRISVEETGRRRGVSTFTATIAVVVTAADETEAETRARALLDE